MKNIIPFKELAYTGGLTITGMYVCIIFFFFLINSTVKLGQLCHKPYIWWWPNKFLEHCRRRKYSCLISWAGSNLTSSSSL